MSRNYAVDNPERDAEEYASRELPVIGKCEHCGEDIYSWETHYNVEGLLLHDDCAIDWLNQFRKYGD